MGQEVKWPIFGLRRSEYCRSYIPFNCSSYKRCFLSFKTYKMSEKYTLYANKARKYVDDILRIHFKISVVDFNTF